MLSDLGIVLSFVHYCVYVCYDGDDMMSEEVDELYEGGFPEDELDEDDFEDPVNVYGVTRVNVIRKGISERLEDGIDAGEYERILGMDALTGGEDNILFETDEQKSKMYAFMLAICYPRRPDGSIDYDVAIDNPVLYTFVQEDKLGMKSNKRKGLMELVKVMRGEEDPDEKLTSRIAGAIKGDD